MCERQIQLFALDLPDGKAADAIEPNCLIVLITGPNRVAVNSGQLRLRSFEFGLKFEINSLHAFVVMRFHIVPELMNRQTLKAGFIPTKKLVGKIGC